MIITANKQDYQTFLSLMGKIDIPKDQVFIEAYIVEMKATRTFNWGVGGMKLSVEMPMPPSRITELHGRV